MPPSGPPGSSADWSGSRPSPAWKLAPQYDQARTCAPDLPSHRWPRGRWRTRHQPFEDRAVEVLPLLADRGQQGAFGAGLDHRGYRGARRTHRPASRRGLRCHSGHHRPTCRAPERPVTHRSIPWWCGNRRREFARPPGSATVLKRASSWSARFASAGEDHADVAQLVEHHLAKVRVAGSNPVVRSEASSAVSRCRWPARLRGNPWSGSQGPGTAEWPSGLGKGLQSPVRGFDSRLRLEGG